MRTSVRRSAFGAVVLAGTAVLASCGGQPDAGGPTAVSEAAATGSAAPSSAEPAPDDLTGLLLPESAFGPDADVHQLPADGSGPWPGSWWHGGGDDADGDDDGHGWWDRHHGGSGHHGWGWHGGDDAAEPAIEPAACADALAALPTLEDAELPEVAAQVAATDAVRTYQVVAEGPALDGLALRVDQLVQACASATVDAPWGMQVSVAVAAVDVPARGDSSGAASITLTHQLGTVSSLVGIVSEGPRAVLLAQTGTAGAAPDQAGFTALLTQAADAADVG